MNSLRSMLSCRGLSTGPALCNRPNIRHPRHPTYERLQLLTLAEPHWSIKHETTEKLWQDCPLEREKRLKKVLNGPNPWEMLYAKELEELLEGSKMTGIFHTNISSKRSRHAVNLLLN